MFSRLGVNIINSQSADKIPTVHSSDEVKDGYVAAELPKSLFIYNPFANKSLAGSGKKAKKRVEVIPIEFAIYISRFNFTE
jgi:hypothetical protein